jgi:hypothetical protein
MIAVRYFAPSKYRNLTIHYNSCLKGSYGCICYILHIVVCINEHDINSICAVHEGNFHFYFMSEGQFCCKIIKNTN